MEEEQASILATLKVVQDKGWSPECKDPFQFHIILGEHIRAKEAKLVEVIDVLENIKEQIQQKDKDIKDMKRDMEHQRNLNEELENDLKVKEDQIKQLEKTETQVNILKHGMINKDSIIGGLDKIIKEKDDDMNQLREAKAIEEKKGVIKNNVIKELKNTLKDKEDINHSEKEELDNLEREIKELEAANKEKERMLENVAMENENLKVKLEKLSTKENLSLGEELNVYLSKTFKCKECGNSFDKKIEMKMHMKNKHEKEVWKIRVQEMERKLSEQKCNLGKDLYYLKEKESTEKLICQCTGVCKINHFRQNWKMSQSSAIFSKFKDSFEVSQDNCQMVAESLQKIACTYCVQSYEKLGDLGRHMKANHKKYTATTSLQFW